MNPHVHQRRAAIDIGTNSVKLLVAEYAEGALEPVWEENEQTRLGEGFYAEKRLQPTPIARTVAAVRRMWEAAQRHGATSVRIIATSAVREARNGSQLVDAVREATGLATEVIPGETEADWSHKGVRSNRRFSSQRLLVLDVGGGSTEFIVGEPGRITFRESFELGTVRAFETLRPPADPSPEDLARARRHLGDFLELTVLPEIGRHLESPVELAVGVGGTTAILALVEQGSPAFDRNAIESHVFTPESLGRLVDRLWSLPLSLRRTLPGLPPERADVILTGCAIYEAILLKLRLPALGISTRGLRFGALLP